MAKKIYLDNLELAQKGYVDSALQDKQDTLVSGENIKTINNQSLLGAGNIAISGSDDYDDLLNQPIINQDLTNQELIVRAENYYRHTGNTTASFTNGAIYYYDGSEFHEITGSSAPSGEGVAVVEFGGYIDYDTFDSYLTLTMEEFMKGIDNDVAFAKVNVGDGTSVIATLYLTKITGQYNEGSYGVLQFTMTANLDGDNPSLMRIQASFENTGSINWDIDFEVDYLGGGATQLNYDELENKPIINQEEVQEVSAFVYQQVLANGTKIHFDTSADMLNDFYSQLTYTPSGSGDYVVLLQSQTFSHCYIQAISINGEYCLFGYVNGHSTPIHATAPMTISGITFRGGWEDLETGDNLTLTEMSENETLITLDGGSWNGNIIGIATTSYSPSGVNGNIYHRDGNLYKYTNNQYKKYIVEGEADPNVLYLGEVNYSYTNWETLNLTNDQIAYITDLNKDVVLVKIRWRISGSEYDDIIMIRSVIVDSNGTQYYFIGNNGNPNTIIGHYDGVNNYMEVKAFNFGEVQGFYYVDPSTGYDNQIPLNYGFMSFGRDFVYDVYSGKLYTVVGYTISGTIASGDRIVDTNAVITMQEHKPIIINGSRYEYQDSTTNASSEVIDRYMSSTLDNGAVKIKFAEFNETSYVITFTEQIVNGGVAYTTTPPTADNLDGDLKFVVLTQAQATGITKYNGYLYYII